jgi:hypothetical protein
MSHERHVSPKVTEIEFYEALFHNVRLLIGEEPLYAFGKVFDATAIELLQRVLNGVAGLQECIVILVANVPKIGGEAPFQYLHIRLLNGRPIR